MQSTHTPGKWEIVPTPAIDSIKPGDSVAIGARAGNVTWIVAEMVAPGDARLIASAPDLLAALQALTEWGCTHTSPRDANSPHALLIAARAAIARATS